MKIKNKKENAIRVGSDNRQPVTTSRRIETVMKMWATLKLKKVIKKILFYIFAGFLLLLWITSSAEAMPDPGLKNEVSSSKNYVGIATQVISNAMFNVRINHTVYINKRKTFKWTLKRFFID